MNCQNNNFSENDLQRGVVKNQLYYIYSLCDSLKEHSFPGIRNLPENLEELSEISESANNYWKFLEYERGLEIFRDFMANVFNKLINEQYKDQGKIEDKIEFIYNEFASSKNCYFKIDELQEGYKKFISVNGENTMPGLYSFKVLLYNFFQETGIGNVIIEDLIIKNIQIEETIEILKIAYHYELQYIEKELEQIKDKRAAFENNSDNKLVLRILKPSI